MVSWHVYWPGYDPFWYYNTPDCQGRIDFYNVSGVPFFRTDGWLPSNASTLPLHFDYETAIDTPVSMTITGLFDTNTGHLDFNVTASTGEALPTGSYRLYVTLTETDLYFAGSNGVTNHPNTMRDCFPDYNGTVANFTGGFPQTVNYAGSTDLDPTFDWDKCRLVAWVQDTSGQKKVQQSIAKFVTDMGDLTAVDSALPEAMLLGQSYPNPFNPSTTIPLNVKRAGAARLDIVGADGRLVRTLLQGDLPAGTRNVTWDGTDAEGIGVASGVYLARLHSADGVQSKRLILMK